uniref:Uncharacterized protein n=1 Tax=Helianthus annuus TaxID=4232 RepID=A0A251V1L6_HELAN
MATQRYIIGPLTNTANTSLTTIMLFTIRSFNYNPVSILPPKRILTQNSKVKTWEPNLHFFLILPRSFGHR